MICGFFKISNYDRFGYTLPAYLMEKRNETSHCYSCNLRRYCLVRSRMGKTDDPPLPKVAQQAPSAQGTLSTPTLPSPQLPDPIVPKGAEAPSPMPGQANDHSSPAFKNGGKADPHK